MTALYAIGSFVVGFAAIWIAAEILTDSLSLAGQWRRDR